MLARIKRYKRILIALGLALLALLIGVITLGENLEFTGLMFLFSAVGILIYYLFFYLLTRNAIVQHTQFWRSKELWGGCMLFGLLCLIGIIESSPNYLGMTVFFTLALLAVLMFSYFKSRNQPLKFPFWLFFIGIGFVLIRFDDDFGDEELYALVAGSYFLILCFLIVQWVFKQVKSIIDLKNEQAKTELLHLQSQVNPHFFFNTLNNLYGLVGKDSKKAQDLILRLSDMMRYSIYEGQKASVSIIEEVEYLKNYIELHKMRYHKKIEVLFKQDLEEEKSQVMPLLFIILLENAFKHGVENLRANAYVHISLTSLGNEICFDVENNFDPTEATTASGIGLKNLKRRLELVYPNKHSLDFSIKENVYKAQLKLVGE